MRPTWVMPGASPFSPSESSRTELTREGVSRNYMAQDIMRRILRDYFGYEVNFVMNITDVDDKVSQRASVCPIMYSD